MVCDSRNQTFLKVLLICSAGITETSGVVSITTSEDIWLGSCGSVLPSIEVRLVTPTGKEVEQYNEPGELLIRSPTVVLGYLSNPDATRKTFRDGWVWTGDVAII